MEKSVNVYEVVRVVNSKPLFVKSHYERFRQSIKHFKICSISERSFIDEACLTIRNLRIVDGNIRIDTFIGSNSDKCKIEIKEIPHHYPTEEQYTRGVNAITYLHERPTPQKKIWHADIRKKIDDIIRNGECYEVLYYNLDNNITEGSRSNLFFIKGDVLYTPKIEHVLPGITRENILHLAKEIGVKLVEDNVSRENITKFDSAFISGTSPNILPLSHIDDWTFDVNNQCLRILMKAFDNLIQSDLKNFEGC